MSRAVARLCSLPLILFFVGYNVRGENASPSVPLLPHGFDCPFQNEKVKGCLRQFFSMLPIADPQAEAHGSIEKNKPLTISFFHVNAFQLLLKGGQWASQLGDKIPQPVVATIVHYLLLIVFVGGIAIGVGFLIFLGASKVFEFYTEDYADTMSLAVFLISLAVSVYFAEPIRAVIPINLLLLLILVHIVYVLIRWYVKGCMRSRGYY